jgi:hypothetical protein
MTRWTKIVTKAAGILSVAKRMTCGYDDVMSPDTKNLLERVASWPQEDQDELAEAAAEIEARRTDIYRLSDDERVAVRKGMDAARRGEFVPDSEMEDFYQSHPRTPSLP